jgi:hypothetical protein
MTKPLSYSATLLALASLGGCFSVQSEQDARPTTTQDLSKLDSFDTIESSGSADIVVKVGGEEQSINLEGSQSRIDNVETKVVDGKLVIEEKSTGLFGNSGKLKITITVPALKAFELNGSGDVTVTGIESTGFEGEINGSGEMILAGEAETVSLAVSGSGDIIADGLKAKNGTVSIAGSGNVNIAAADQLTVNVTGSGDVTYFGEPKITQTVTGSGEVTKG